MELYILLQVVLFPPMGNKGREWNEGEKGGRIQDASKTGLVWVKSREPSHHFSLCFLWFYFFLQWPVRKGGKGMNKRVIGEKITGCGE